MDDKERNRIRGRKYYQENKDFIKAKNKLQSKEVYLRRKLREAGLIPAKQPTNKTEAIRLIRQAVSVTIADNVIILHSK